MKTNFDFLNICYFASGFIYLLVNFCASYSLITLYFSKDFKEYRKNKTYSIWAYALLLFLTVLLEVIPTFGEESIDFVLKVWFVISNPYPFGIIVEVLHHFIFSIRSEFYLSKADDFYALTTIKHVIPFLIIFLSSVIPGSRINQNKSRDEFSSEIQDAKNMRKILSVEVFLKIILLLFFSLSYLIYVFDNN